MRAGPVLLIVLLPLMVTSFLGFFVVIPGLAWSPFAALMAWWMARRRGMGGGLYALRGAAFSVFLLVPWFLMVAALHWCSVPVSMLRWSYGLLFSVWLAGPIVFWGQYVAEINFLQTLGLGSVTQIDPDRPFIAYGVLIGMVVAWVVSAVTTLKLFESKYVVDVGPEDLANLRGMMPYILAWGCTVVVLGYGFLGLK